MPPKQAAGNPSFQFAKRVLTMDRRELFDRIRQQFRQRTDAVLFAVGMDPSRSEYVWQEPGSRRFFFRTEEIPKRIELLRQRMPGQVEKIIQRAERICQHRFDLLGYENLEYGPEMNWHFDSVHGKQAPRDLWFTIPYLDFKSVGDAKIIWELNRHQHLVTLAKAYRLTDDPRFAKELIDQWKHWQTKNPYPRGINWASNLEVAFRSLSWLWVYFLLQGTPVMTADLAEQWLRAMALHGRHIESYISTYFSPNTHLLGEAIALFFIGTLCPELRSSARWKQKGWQTVLQESEHQVRSDGFHFEQSTYYHVYALDFFLHAGILASLNGMPFPPAYNVKLEQMLDALTIMCRAGTPSRFGDEDGGRVFDPSRNRAEHLSDPLATGAILFRRGDFKFVAGEICEEILWLHGEQGMETFDRLEARKPNMDSVAFRDAGFYVMSSAEGELQAIIDAGPQGALSAGHGHADALSMTVHACGKELLTDPGRYQYVGAGTRSAQCRGTAAHNTLQLDGRNQAEPKGPFSWRSLTNTKVERWISGKTFDFFAGNHDGYSSPANPAIHRRSVFFRKSKFWLVRDQMLGIGQHQLDVRWHLHPGLAAGDGPVFGTGRSAEIAVFSAGTDDWSRIVERAAWSAAYGREESATEIRFTAATDLPAEFATLLAPRSMTHRHLGARTSFTQVSSSPPLNAYILLDDREEHLFVFADSGRWAFRDWKSDAEFLYCCRSEGKLSLLIFCNATQVDFRGNKLISAPEPALYCEIFPADDKTQLLSSADNLVISEGALQKLFETPETVPQRNDGTGL
ncbi:MAG TPA: alginate lyase family protein [Candidatus Acidoferrum sp.]